MRHRIQPRPLEVNSVRNIEYDLLIATTGFEKRARYLTQMLDLRGKIRWAPAFTNRQELSFEENRAFFQGRGFEVRALTDDEFRKLMAQNLDQAVASAGDGNAIKVLVDVSSMSRFRMATIIDIVNRYPKKIAVSADFIYSVAEYSEPPETEFPIEDCGPVSAAFAGWASDPTLPVVAVFGVGYERDQVIGVLDLLEASMVWAFVPKGPDPRYLEKVNAANRSLFGEVSEVHQFSYDVMRPYEVFGNVESLLYGLSALHRPIVIPFGPKIFATCAMLAGAALHPKVSVWRVSTGQNEPPIDRLGSPNICGISADFLVDLVA